MIRPGSGAGCIARNAAAVVASSARAGRRSSATTRTTSNRARSLSTAPSARPLSSAIGPMWARSTSAPRRAAAKQRLSASLWIRLVRRVHRTGIGPLCGSSTSKSRPTRSLSWRSASKGSAEVELAERLRAAIDDNRNHLPLSPRERATMLGALVAPPANWWAPRSPAQGLGSPRVSLSPPAVSTQSLRSLARAGPETPHQRLRNRRKTAGL